MVEERGRFSIDEVFEMVEHWYFEIDRAKSDYMTAVQPKFMIELSEKKTTGFHLLLFELNELKLFEYLDVEVSLNELNVRTLNMN